MFLTVQLVRLNTLLCILNKYNYFRLTITDESDDENEMVPANLGPLYQNQESDPAVRSLMYDFSSSGDKLPDLPTP